VKIISTKSIMITWRKAERASVVRSSLMLHPSER
jgi:hypothetical protein